MRITLDLVGPEDAISDVFHQDDEGTGVPFV